MSNETKTDKRNLQARLTAARLAIGEIAHDKRNDHHKYPYTSAEAIIGRASRVLASEGLTTLPVSTVYEQFGSGVKLLQTWLLQADGCDPTELRREMYCEPGHGRPLDKQLCGASTVNLAYLFRDLLGIPPPDKLGKDDDITGRDDTNYVPPKSRKADSSPPTVTKPVEKSVFDKGGKTAATETFPPPEDKLTGVAYTQALLAEIRKRNAAVDADQALQRAARAYSSIAGIAKVSTANLEQRSEFIALVADGSFDAAIGLEPDTDKAAGDVDVDSMRTSYTLVDVRRMWGTLSGERNDNVVRVALDLHAADLYKKIGKTLSASERKLVASALVNKSIDLKKLNQQAADEIANAK